MNPTTFTTRSEAVYRLIVEPLEACADPADFDIEAIADLIIEDHKAPTETTGRFTTTKTPDEFWSIVAAHELPMQ